MRNTSLLQKDLSIPQWIVERFPQYVGITENDNDLELIRSCNDVFATSLIAQKVSVDKFSHRLNLAQGIASTLHAYINSDLDLIDYLENLEGNDEKQLFFLQFLKIQTSCLEKSDVNLYLNLLLNNVNVPRQKIDEKLEFGGLYTFTFLTNISEFWEKQKIFENFNWTILDLEKEEPIETTQIAIYQATPAYPPIVLLNLNYQDLAQKILEQHQQYILNLIIEMLLNTRSDYIDQHLQFQPYKYQSLKQFIDVLVKQCTTLSEKRNIALENNPIIIGYYERNLKTDKTIDQIESELKTQVKQEKQQEKQQQQQSQQQQQQEVNSVFATQKIDSVQQKQGKRFITQHV